jgi:hypothetical protein
MKDGSARVVSDGDTVSLGGSKWEASCAAEGLRLTRVTTTNDQEVQRQRAIQNKEHELSKRREEVDHLMADIARLQSLLEENEEETPEEMKEHLCLCKLRGQFKRCIVELEARTEARVNVTTTHHTTTMLMAPGVPSVCGGVKWLCYRGGAEPVELPVVKSEREVHSEETVSLQQSVRGVFSRQWGSAGDAEGQFRSPDGVAVSAGGEVFVSDSPNHRIQVLV